MKSYLRVQVKSNIPCNRRSNRTKMATSWRHLVTKHETGRTHVWKGYAHKIRDKEEIRNIESRMRLSLIHSDPFYLENSSRKGRSISRKAWRARGGLSPRWTHSGRYLDWTVNPDSKEKTLSNGRGRINGLHSASLLMLSSEWFSGPGHRSWSP